MSHLLKVLLFFPSVVSMFLVLVLIHLSPDGVDMHKGTTRHYWILNEEAK